MDTAANVERAPLHETKETRAQRYLSLIDRSLGYLLTQESQVFTPERKLEHAAPASVMACICLWAFQEPSSRYHKEPLLVERARQAMDCLVAHHERMHPDFFSPAPMLEAITVLKSVAPEDPESTSRWLSCALLALEEQSHGSLHDGVGHWSDWDTFFAWGAALAWQLTGDNRWRELASQHIQVLRINVADEDGFLHWTTPYENWNPTMNYGGLMLSNLGRYVELSGDLDAAALIDATKENFLYRVEQSGLMDFTPSIYPKHQTENKKDSYSFGAAACEFLAARTRDGRYARAAEIMLGSLERMMHQDGSLDMKAWPVAAAGHSPGLQALSTLYLHMAFKWGQDGPEPQDLPDNHLEHHENLHGFKARYGDFSYSVGCNESLVSLMGAAYGLNSLVEGVFCLIKDKGGALYGQVGPFWREYCVGDGEAMASTAFYHPVLVRVATSNLPLSPWAVRQTYLGIGPMVIGFVTYESPVDADGKPIPGGESLLTDIHLGPAGREVVWGRQVVLGRALVETENPEPTRLASLPQGAWVHYGELCLHFIEFFGEGAKLSLWDAVKGRMQNPAPVPNPLEFNTVVANDAVIEFSAEAPGEDAIVPKAAMGGGAYDRMGGARSGLLFTVAPSPSVRDAMAGFHAGDVRVISAPTPGCRQIAIRHEHTWYVAVITHEPGIRTLPVELEMPADGRYEVTVYAKTGSPPIRSSRVEGRQVRLNIPTVAPVLLVRISSDPKC